MKIILDTNVLVSGLFFSGISFKILQGVSRSRYKLVVSPEIVDEYKRTVDKISHRFPNIIGVNSQLELIVLSSHICQSSKLTKPVCLDPDDEKFIACALGSNTRIIVSGDRHLLNVSGFRGIEVLTPRHFWEKYVQSSNV